MVGLIALLADADSSWLESRQGRRIIGLVAIGIVALLTIAINAARRKYAPKSWVGSSVAATVIGLGAGWAFADIFPPTYGSVDVFGRSMFFGLGVFFVIMWLWKPRDSSD